MGALIAILVIIGGWEALKDGYRHMRDSSRKPNPGTGGRRYSGNSSRGGSRGGSSARHDTTGYWASEVGHGFPHFRHGFAKGWSRHQQIRDDLYRDRQKARAEHLENRTGVVADVQDYRKRQRAAQDKIAETTAPQDGTGDGQEEETPLPSEQGRRRHSQRLPWPDSGMAAVTPITGNGSETSRPPADSSGESSDTPPGGSPEDAPGGDSGPGNTPDSASGSNGDRGSGLSPSQEGSNSVPADTNYDEVLQQFRAFAEQAEQKAAELGQIRGQAEQLTDAAQGAEVDPQSLGEMADIVDAAKKAEEEAKVLQEQASAFPDSFAKRHGMLAEAHQSAPVRAAEQDFYTGG